MSEIDYESMKRDAGIGVNLNEFKDGLELKKVNFIEIKDVKSFEYNNIKKDNISTLIILNRGVWGLKNSGCSGRSGIKNGKIKIEWCGDFELDSYKLTINEMHSILKGVPGFGKTIKIKKHIYYEYEKNSYSDSKTLKMRGFSTKDIKSKPSYFKYSLIDRTDCDPKELSKCLDILRDFAENKFLNENKTIIKTYYINGLMFQYTAKIKENLSSISEDLSYAFYFYDEDGNYIDGINNGISTWG
jgi:hypothetical protein